MCPYDGDAGDEDEEVTWRSGRVIF